MPYMNLRVIALEETLNSNIRGTFKASLLGKVSHYLRQRCSVLPQLPLLPPRQRCTPAQRMVIATKPIIVSVTGRGRFPLAKLKVRIW